jgi:hypothetical protein
MGMGKVGGPCRRTQEGKGISMAGSSSTKYQRLTCGAISGILDVPNHLNHSLRKEHCVGSYTTWMDKGEKDY